MTNQSNLKILVFLFILILSTTRSFSQVSFSKKYPMANSASVISACEASNNGILILYTITPDTGLPQFYLMRCNEYGDSLWTRSGFYYYDIYADIDGGFYLKNLTEFLKIDSMGNTVWNFQTFYMYDNISDVCQANDSSYFILGVRDTVNCCSPINKHLYKYDKNGNMLWERYYYGDYRQVGIHATSDNGAMIIAMTPNNNSTTPILIKINSTGDSLWSKSFSQSQNSSTFLPSNPISIFPNNDIVFMTNTIINYNIIRTDANANVIEIDSTPGSNSIYNCIKSGIDGSVLIFGGKTQPDQNIQRKHPTNHML